MELLFVLLSLVAIAGALGVILFSQPIHSGLSFIAVVVALAGLFALLSSTFLFMVQIILYAGAVITLILFVIMVLNVRSTQLPDETGQRKPLLLGAVCLAPFLYLVVHVLGSLESEPLYILPNAFGGIELLGAKLFTEWVLPFELVSVLLLAALVGAVILAKKEKA